MASKFGGTPVNQTVKKSKFGGTATNRGESADDFSFSEMAGNIGPSALQFGKDVITPFLHPVDTFNSLTGLSGSALAKADEAMVSLLPQSVVDSTDQWSDYIASKTGLPNALPSTDQANAVGQFFADRYGSLDQAKQTLMKDPVGLLGDVSGVLSGGAMLLPKATKLGQILQKTGTALDPLNATFNAGKIIAAKVTPNSLPNSLYQSAAKFPNGVNATDPSILADTALKYGLLPTAAGVGKLEIGIQDLGGKIDDMIKAADDTGIEIPKDEVLKHLNALKDDLGGARLDGGKNLDIINKIIKDFDDHMWNINKDTFTPSELNQFKRDIYESLSYGTVKAKGERVSDKVGKAIAKAAKEGVEAQNPDIKKSNAELGKLIDLQVPLMQSARRIDKRNPLSIDSGINIAAGGAAGGGTGAMAGAGISLLAYPKIQANIANQLYNFKRKGLLNMGGGSIPLGLFDQAAFQSGRMENDPRFNRRGN